MATSQRTDVARRDEAQQQAVQLSREEARKFIEPFLPEGMSVERVAATIQLAIKNDETGALRKCTRESLVLGAARILQWHLDLGTTAYLIPFGNKAVPVASYQGLASLAIASRAVRFFDPQVVRDGDVFEYQLGTEGFVRHRPLSKNTGPITHVYCVVTLPYGAKVFDVMSIEEVDEVRLTYSKQWKKGPCPAWYAKKTIIRRVTKMLPKDPALAAFFAAVEQESEVELGGDDTRAGVRSLSHEETPVATARAEIGQHEGDGSDSDDSTDDNWLET